MRDAVWKQWKVMRRYWSWLYLVILGCWLAGIVIMNLIMLTDAQPETYFTVGTAMGGFAAIFYGLFMAGGSFASYFSVEVGFGCTRKRFFFSYYLVGAVQCFLTVPVLAGLYLAERALYGWWYPGCANEMDLLPMLLKLGAVLSLVLPLLAMLASLLVMRFGRPAFWVMWGLWMLGFVVVPNMLDAAETDTGSAYSWAGRKILWLAGLLNVTQWICVGAAAVLLCAGIAYRMAMRQQVNS